MTASLLVEFEAEALADRDRIELCSDESYRLLGERKSRYKKKASSKSNESLGTVKTVNTTEHIVIDSDSD